MKELNSPDVVHFSGNAEEPVQPTNLREEWLQDFDIVCLANCEYMVVRSVAEHTMIRLAQKNRVMMVEPFNSWPTLLREARMQNRKRKWRWGLRQIEDNIWAYSPPPIGIPGHTRARWVTAANSAIFAFLLRRAIRKLHFKHPLLWSYSFNSAGVMRRLKARLSIYDCIDNDRALARNDAHRRLVRDHDEDTCRSANLVFACSEALAEERKSYNQNLHEVYCATDIDFFGQALNPILPVPEDLQALPGPIIGYVGGIETLKIDVDLVRYIAMAKPGWSVVLVGFVWFGFEMDQWSDLPNVHILGAKPYEQLPAYMRHMDVCIAPFLLNDITRYGDSLKIYEYLSAGKTVVSTPIPSALRMSPPTHIAQTPAAFVQEIESAMKKHPGTEAENRAAVERHTWDHRVAEKSRIIKSVLLEQRLAAGIAAEDNLT